ncbi:alpha/beta hydrolase [Candidatus Omnitrophota bacterium]
MLLRNVTFFLICCLLLTGCSFHPVQKAEAYLTHLYRRIPYTIEGDYRVIDIFYASAREIKTKKDGSLKFTSKLADRPTAGRLTAKIDPTLTIGKMIPSRLRRKGIIGLQKVERLDDAVFIEQLKKAVDTSPHHSLLVTVFGYKDDFEMTSIKASYFVYLLDINTPILMFDWPGDQPVSISGYNKARKLAEPSGAYLGAVLTEIIRKVKPKELWIESSSLGCQVVCDAFEYMYRHHDLADADEEITHVILTAPDVGEDEFDERFKDEITALTERLTTYVSSNDEALLLSSIISMEKKLGRQKTIKPKEQEHFEEAKDLLYLQSLKPDKFAMVDVTPINKASYNHGYYLEAPEYFDDFYLRVRSKKVDANRRLYLIKHKDNIDYWVLRD